MSMNGQRLKNSIPLLDLERFEAGDVGGALLPIFRLLIP
jgi:hypothetical protein